MKASVFLLCGLIACAYPACADDVVIDTSVVRDVRSGDMISAEIHPGLPARTFRLIADPEANVIQKIEVYNAGRKEPVQTLEAGQGESPYQGSPYFRVVDINFDGYQDIGILTSWGATGNESWRFWQFNPISEKFFYNKTLSELPHPDFDPNAKTVRAFTKGGACESTATTYSYQNGKLHVLKAIRCNFNQEDPPQCECHPLVQLSR